MAVVLDVEPHVVCAQCTLTWWAFARNHLLLSTVTYGTVQIPLHSLCIYVGKQIVGFGSITLVEQTSTNSSNATNREFMHQPAKYKGMPNSTTITTTKPSNKEPSK